MRWEKQGQKWHCFFCVVMRYSSSGPGVSVLNDREIRLHPFPGEGILRSPALREERSLKPPKFIGHLQDKFFLYTQMRSPYLVHSYFLTHIS